jgi:hypothetical protein
MMTSPAGKADPYPKYGGMRQVWIERRRDTGPSGRYRLRFLVEVELDLGVDLVSAGDRSWGTVRICHLPVRIKVRHERHSLTHSARFRHSDNPKRNQDMAKRSTARALLSEYADDPPDSQSTGQ